MSGMGPNEKNSQIFIVMTLLPYIPYLEIIKIGDMNSTIRIITGTLVFRTL